MFFDKLIQTLSDHKIRYALAGGFAVALHGAVRGTVDVDLVIQLSLESFEKIEKVLLKLNLHPRLPVKAQEVFTFRDEYIQNKNLIAWSFVNPSHPSEIVDVLIPFDLEKMKVQRLRYKNYSIPVLTKEELIQMKEKTGRPQDQEDVRALRALGGKK